MVTFQMQVKLGCRPMQSQMSSKEIVHAKTEDQNMCSLKSLATFSLYRDTVIFDILEFVSGYRSRLCVSKLKSMKCKQHLEANESLFYK